jgi:hypothetical protein
MVENITKSHDKNLIINGNLTCFLHLDKMNRKNCYNSILKHLKKTLNKRTKPTDSTLIQPKLVKSDFNDDEIFDDVRSYFSTMTNNKNEHEIISIYRNNQQRRTSIEPRQAKFNFKSLITLLKSASMGEYSLPISAGFNEPLSYMQKAAEGLQFSYLLDKAAECDHNSSLMQMVSVTAFDIALGSCLYERTAKPFTPLLNETYECDRTQDGKDSLGWRYMSEYYAHYPPSYASVI